MKKWDYVSCKNEALKYTSKSDFFINSGSAYNYSKRNGLFDEITTHMINKKKPKNYWTFDRCKEEAIKYTTKIDFRNKSNVAYQTAKNKKFLDVICVHMIPLGNYNKKFIYSYEFPNNYVYVGLTYNTIKRNMEHMTDVNSPVYKHMINTNQQPIKKQLNLEPVNAIDAKQLENYWINQYRSEGWNILNKMKGGALGGNKIYWTFDRCKEEALKYNTRYEFQKKSGSAYNVALKNKWLVIICSHMIKTQKPTGYWTFDRCKKEASKYSTRYEFQKKSISAYSAASKKKWLNLICQHMS